MKSPTVEQLDKPNHPRARSHNDARSPKGVATFEGTQKLVYLVDDDAELRRSLEFLMATQNILLRSFESGCDFFDVVEGLSAAPIILDVRMPKMTGIEFQEELKIRNIPWPVIVVTGHGQVATAVTAIKLGAIDFLEKPVRAIDLENCLQRAFRTLENESTSETFKAASLQLLSRLTFRESEVLTELCDGQSNKQVAFNLSISPRTVEMHRAKILRQLGIRSIAEAVTLINRSKDR